MARDIADDPIADGSALFVATDGPTADGTELDQLLSAANGRVAIVASVGTEAGEAFADASFGSVSDVVGVAVGAEPVAKPVLTRPFEPTVNEPITLDDPGDLGEVGQAINRHLSDHAGKGRPVVIVNSLTELLRVNTAEEVFYFLHLLIGIIESIGGVGLFVYDIAQHETHELATLSELGDGVVATASVAETDAVELTLPAPSLGDRVVNTLVAYTPALWLLAVLTFGITDIVTTYIGLSYGLAYEASPLAAMIFDDNRFGYIYVAKGAIFLLFFLIWRFVPRPYDVSVPLGLSLMGIAITIWNSYVILVGALG